MSDASIEESHGAPDDGLEVLVQRVAVATATDAGDVRQVLETIRCRAPHLSIPELEGMLMGMTLHAPPPAEIPGRVLASPSLVAASPSSVFTCPRCKHTDATDFDPGEHVLFCDECGARIAFGVLQPRVVIRPADDRRFVELRFGSMRIVLDHAYARQIGLELASSAPFPAATEPAATVPCSPFKSMLGPLAPPSEA